MLKASGPETLARHARWLNRQAVNRGHLPSLFFLTDAARTPDPISVVRNLPAATAAILRHYTDNHRYTLARDLAHECRKRRLLFLVAGSECLARDVHADGVHLPEWQIPRIEAYRRQGRLRFLTASAHTIPSLIKAGEFGASAAFASPVFGTASHPGRPHLGVTNLARFARISTVPVYALGGISHRNSKRLLKTGVAGIAAIGAFLNA